MSVIVQATPEMLPKLAAMGAEFYAEGRLPGRFKPDVFERTWNKLLAAQIGSIFVLHHEQQPVGAIGGAVFPDPNDGDPVATEFFWFVTKEHRGTGGVRLLDTFERWAKGMGARRLLMVHLQNLNPDGLRQFYERRGFQHVESHYLKEI